MKTLYLIAIVLISNIPTIVFAQNVAIIDQGENTRSIYNTNADNFFTRQYCFGAGSTYSNFSTSTPPTKLVYASYCHNDTYRDLDTYSGARIPRIATAFRYNGQPTNETSISEEVGRSPYHGNSVSSAIYEFSTDINHTHIQVFFESTPSGSNSLVVKSGVGYVQAALAYTQNIIDPDNIKAVNASLGANDGLVSNPLSLCNQGYGQQEVDDLYARGVLVFAGLLNEDLPVDTWSWPACLDKVVKVGRVGTTSAIGVGGNGIDFFAKGTAPVPSGSIGNSFAAPRVASFYALLSEKFPFATIQEKLDTMKVADRMHTYKGNTRHYIKKEDIAPAIALLVEDYNEFPTIAERVAGGELIINEVEQHGPLFSNDKPEYQLQFDLNNLPAQPNQGQNQKLVNGIGVLDGRRDAVLSFRASSSSFSTTIYMRVLVNGVVIGDYPASNAGLTHIIEIHRKFLVAGNNTVTIKPVVPNSPILWGIDQVKMNFHPAIDLSLGVTDTNEYGYEHSPARYTGVRFRVDIEDRSLNHKISMTGWDIDTADETEVYINGTFLGHLDSGANNAYSVQSSFLAPKDLLRNGVNHIELVQRETSSTTPVWLGFQDEKWAVKDILVKPQGNSLVPVIMLLLDEEE